jgi:hypothetical protein
VSGYTSHETVAPCVACGARLTGENGQAFWVKTALGITVLRTCREGDCADRAVREHREQPAKRIPPPPVKGARENT